MPPYEQIDVAARLRAVGANDPSYVDLAYTGPATFSVYRIPGGSTTFEAKYRTAAQPLHLLFAPAMLPTSQTDQLSRLVLANQSWLQAHGVRLQSFGPGTPGPFIIGYTEPTPPPSNLLNRFLIFGPGTVIFKHETLLVAN